MGLRSGEYGGSVKIAQYRWVNMWSKITNDHKHDVWPDNQPRNTLHEHSEPIKTRLIYEDDYSNKDWIFDWERIHSELHQWSVVLFAIGVRILCRETRTCNLVSCGGMWPDVPLENELQICTCNTVGLETIEWIAMIEALSMGLLTCWCNWDSEQHSNKCVS